MRRSRANRVDLNHVEIVNALRKISSLSVRATPLGDGFPDIIVGYNGHNFLFEIKSEKGRLRASQERFRREWFGQVFEVRGLKQIIEIITATKRG